MLWLTGNNQLYMAGGEFPDGSASRSMWRYDPCFDAWQEVASMNVPRSELGRHCPHYTVHTTVAVLGLVVTTVL